MHGRGARATIARRLHSCGPGDARAGSPCYDSRAPLLEENAMHRAALTLPLMFLLFAPAALAERYTDQPSTLQIEVPEKWKLDEGRKHTTITSPDGAVTMLVVSMRHFASP